MLGVAIDQHQRESVKHGGFRFMDRRRASLLRGATSTYIRWIDTLGATHVRTVVGTVVLL